MKKRHILKKCDRNSIALMAVVFLQVFGLVLGTGETIFAQEFSSLEYEENVKGDANSPDWYSGAYSTYNPFAWSDLYGQCTWYAYGRAYERTGVALDECRIGNAYTWYNTAKNAGRKVGSTPKANSIAVFNTTSGYGHVAYVEAVNGNTVTVSEANNSALGNWTSQKQNTLVAGINCYSGQHSWTVEGMKKRYTSESLIGYIYLVDDPEPGTPVISARSTYYTDENITFSWSAAANAVTYGISLYTRPSSGDRTLVYDKAGVTGNSYSIGKFAAGNYRLWLAGYNSSGVRGATTYVDISVTKRPVIYVSSISLNKTALTLTKGQSATLTASVSPANANNKSVLWTTSNSKVATVSNGTVKSVGVGTATITAKAADGSGKTAVCSVTVKDNHKHSYSAKVTKAPTCTATGVRTYTCSCGASYTEQIEKTAHKAVTDSAVAATCTRAGKTEGSHCSVCGAVIKQQEVIPKKEHNYQEASMEKASPGKNGAVIRKCSSCGNSISTTIYAPQKIELSKTKYTYNGKTRKPSVRVTDSNENILNAGADYTVSYSKGCKKVGTYTVTVNFTGNYSGKSKETFTIAPKGTKITGYRGKTKSSMVIYWKKQANQTRGYEIQYSTNSSFTKDVAKTMTINKKSTTSKTLSKLKKNQTYYVRVRTYQTVRINGKSTKITSDWSKAVEIAR